MLFFLGFNSSGRWLSTTDVPHGQLPGRCGHAWHLKQEQVPEPGPFSCTPVDFACSQLFRS
jgi:hypothetical protein